MLASVTHMKSIVFFLKQTFSRIQFAIMHYKTLQNSFPLNVTFSIPVATQCSKSVVKKNPAPECVVLELVPIWGERNFKPRPQHKNLVRLRFFF